MTDKANFITMLGKSDVSFQVKGNDVTVSTSNNDDKTTFTFDDPHS